MTAQISHLYGNNRVERSKTYLKYYALNKKKGYADHSNVPTFWLFIRPQTDRLHETPGEIVFIVEEIHFDWQLLRFCADLQRLRDSTFLPLSEYFSSYYKLIACIFRVIMTIICGITKNLVLGGQFINYYQTVFKIRSDESFRLSCTARLPRD